MPWLHDNVLRAIGTPHPLGVKGSRESRCPAGSLSEMDAFLMTPVALRFGPGPFI